MHIWYQYNVTKSHKIIKYHPVSPGCHPLVIPPCTHVMNIYDIIPVICTCRFPGQVMPLQQPSAGDGTGLGVPSAGDNVPEQGTSPEQGHHNPWNNGLQFQDLAFQALAIEFVSVPRKGLNKNLPRSWQVHTYTSLSFSKLWEFIRNNSSLDFFHILIFTNELDDYMLFFFVWCVAFLRLGVIYRCSMHIHDYTHTLLVDCMLQPSGSQMWL